MGFGVRWPWVLMGCGWVRVVVVVVVAGVRCGGGCGCWREVWWRLWLPAWVCGCGYRCRRGPDGGYGLWILWWWWLLWWRCLLCWPIGLLIWALWLIGLLGLPFWPGAVRVVVGENQWV
uniref:Transmembrane protein n=1 Tax=Fagus sylvatica TaxID=28930 RepID=A0A2N9HGK8_FAGSY